jgi:hypothetical protein
MMGRSIQAILAGWRRRHGTWIIEVGGEGYDDIYRYVCSGSHSQRDAEALAKYHISRAHGDSIGNFFIVSSRREG